MNVIAAAVETELPAAPAHPASQYPASILVVDDEASIRRVATLALTGAGHKVDEAVDGWAGWEMARENRYDLVITDNQMPRLSGLEFIKRLRRTGIMVPVVLASGTPASGTRPEDQGLALVARLSKPYSVGQLMAAVEAILGGRGGFATVRRGVFPIPPENLVSPSPTRGWGLNE